MMTDANTEMPSTVCRNARLPVGRLRNLPGAGNVRVVGNLLGDPEAEVVIGSEVRAVFEHHADADPSFTLLQWERATIAT